MKKTANLNIGLNDNSNILGKFLFCVHSPSLQT